jgi:hypothetical protein
MVAFFTGTEWWKTELHDELVNHGALYLAELAGQYTNHLSYG